MRLTAAGERLLVDTRPHVEALQRVLSRTRRTADGARGTLRVAAYERIIAGPRFAQIVDAFRQRHPEADVDYRDSGGLDYLSYLRAGECEIVIARLPCSDGDLTVGPVLTREQRLLLTSHDHPLADRALVTLEDVADSGTPVTDTPTPGMPREMMDAFIPPLTPSGRRLPRRLTPTISSAIVGVANGDQVHPTVASIFEYLAHPKVKAVPLDLPPSETALVWVTAATTTLIEAFAKIAAEVADVPALVASGASR